jgi:hypothetical protein
MTAPASQRFLRMLPPAVLTAWPPDEEQTPVALALLGALEQEWLRLAADVDSILDDAFPDSAHDWALPYIGTLLGLPADAGRREIAYATALRRRKGTPAAIEDFAEIVTGWPARVSEGWKTTLWCQQLRHPVRRTASLNLRAGEHLMAGSGLDPARHTVTPGGAHHPAAATAEVFPWQVLRFDQVETKPLGDGRESLHPFGASAPLYLAPRPLVIASDAEDERPPGAPLTARPPRPVAQLPIRATFRVIAALGDVSYGPVWTLAADHPLTGPGPALFELTVDGVPVPWSNIGLAALPPGVATVPGADQVLLDPARGVILPGSDIAGTLRGTYYRAVPGALGPLAATARLRDDVGQVIVVDPSGNPHPPGQQVFADLPAAVAAAHALPNSSSRPGVPQVEIRLLTGDRLTAPAAVTGSPALTHWRIVAPEGSTPVVVGDLELDMTDGQLELVGFYLDGTLKIGPAMAGVDLDGMALDAAGGAELAVDPTAWTVRVTARRSLLGPIRADLSAAPLELTDCLVDGTGAALMPCGGDPGGDPTRAALAAADRFPPDLVATGVTFVGPVGADEVWVTDCLFTGGLRTTVTSTGCVRFCHLGPADDPQAHPPGYHCLSGNLPRFGSLGFEASGYYAPVLDSPSARPFPPLLTGASDSGEIGAYHHARRGPLAIRLAQRLAEMTPLRVHPHLAVARPEE